MANSNVRVFPDSTGKLIDTESVVDGASTLQRQRVRIGGSGLSELADVKNGALQVGLNQPGIEADTSADVAGDGLIDLTAGPDLLVNIAVGAGVNYHLTSWNWLADRQCMFKLVVADSGVTIETLRIVANSGSNPSDIMYFPTPIKIVGASGREIRILTTRLNGQLGTAHAAVNGFTS